MKAIILFSSIFYILGLKIGHKIDIFKNVDPVEKITTTNEVKPTTKAIYFNDEVKIKADADSIKNIDVLEKTTREKNQL